MNCQYCNIEMFKMIADKFDREGFLCPKCDVWRNEFSNGYVVGFKDNNNPFNKITFGVYEGREFTNLYRGTLKLILGFNYIIPGHPADILQKLLKLAIFT